MMGKSGKHRHNSEPREGVVPAADRIDTPLRTAGLGYMHVLGDKRVLSILCYLEAADLQRLALASKALYVFTHYDKLWRDLTFRRFRGAFRFKKNWRYTALLRADREVKPDEFPKELVVAGLKSDYMFRHWYRSTMDRKAYDISFSHIEKRTGVPYEEFVEQYLKVGRPVILKDAALHWKALRWTPDTLIRDYGDVTFRLNWGAWSDEHKKIKRIYMTMKDFWHYARQHNDCEPGYVFDAAFHKRAPAMADEFDRTSYFKEDLYAVLGEHRPDYRWFLCGPPGSGSPWHIDPHATSAWNGLLYGRKRWGLYPPSMAPPGIRYREGKHSVSYDSPKAFRWYLETYPTLTPEQRPLELIQEPGEVIFVPAGWWHTVLNVTETVAVTQNWLDRFNFNVGWADALRDNGPMRAELYERLRYVRPELFANYELEINRLMGGAGAVAKDEQAVAAAATRGEKKRVTFQVAEPEKGSKDVKKDGKRDSKKDSKKKGGKKDGKKKAGKKDGKSGKTRK